MKKFNWQ